ncbi:MAG TPA: alpha/beta hydrolase [Tepidisphaeraceae bacterium]|jgi:hypothetical protein|nr:alpha/beta hydrolase [Tepidisphaeraceae bacterium]
MIRSHLRKSFALALFLCIAPLLTGGEPPSPTWDKIAPAFSPPRQFAGQYGALRSPLRFDDGTVVKTAADWPRRRAEILSDWNRIMGQWPPLIDKPKIEYRATTRRENFTQHQIRIEVAKGLMDDGYLLVPDGKGPFPAVFVPFYDAETSIGLGKSPLRDFAYQLTKRGFVTLSIGSPGGDASKPDLAGNVLQPLSYLGYIGANCYNALASLPNVDPKRVGVVGHSYGGKWAMFASCLYDKYAAAAWSDPGIVWDEKRANVNYWEPWYLGLDPDHLHKPGLITPENPRTGAYKALVEGGHDLTELHALMAPRPFLVSGGSEDTPERWIALNHAIAVNAMLGQKDRVAMTNRPAHQPTEESNEAIYLFFEHFLMGKN